MEFNIPPATQETKSATVSIVDTLSNGVLHPLHHKTEETTSVLWQVFKWSTTLPLSHGSKSVLTGGLQIKFTTTPM